MQKIRGRYVFESELLDYLDTLVRVWKAEAEGVALACTVSDKLSSEDYFEGLAALAGAEDVALFAEELRQWISTHAQEVLPTVSNANALRRSKRVP